MQRLPLLRARLLALPLALAVAACNESPVGVAGPQPRFDVDAVCPAPAVYVANTHSDNVSVISTTTNTVVETITVGDTPQGVAITPSGAFAYVSNQFGNTVSVISTATNTVVETIPVDEGPRDLAVTPDGAFVYVAHGTSASPDLVSVISTASNSVVATVSVGNSPLGVAVAPDGDLVYVSNAGDDNVAVISTATNAVVETIPVGEGPARLAITPDGAFVYVANGFFENSVSVISTATHTVVETIPVGENPFGVTITPDGAFAYVTNAVSDNVSVLSTATNSVVQTIPVGNGPTGVAITPDGEFAYVSNRLSGDPDGNTVMVIATATNTVVETIPAGDGPSDGPFALAITPSCDPNSVPTADAGGPYVGSEGSAVTFDGSGSTDPDNDALTYDWDFGDGHTGTGVTASHTYADNGLYTVTLTVNDGTADSDPVSTTATVANVAPDLGSITPSTVDPIPVNSTAFSVSADFTDPGVLDTHTATIDWGDGSTADATATVDQGSGSGSVSGTHLFTAAGVYTVTITLTDNDAGSDSEIYQYVVVYDPDAGFVTGAGWIDSPAGAYLADPSLTGKANFGFVSKYKTGASTPTGSTQFRFHTAGMNFQSDVQEWLVVSQGGANAQFKGTGTINGAGTYKFMIWAEDGSPDTFRIRIWEEIGGVESTIYDNGFEQAISAGSIKIHIN